MQSTTEEKRSWAVKAAFSLCERVTQLPPACCWREHIRRHGGHPSQRRVALVSRCHLPVASTDVAWKEQRSDSPATKIRPFRCLGKRLTAPTPTPPAWHKCTGRTKSKRAVGRSPSAQLGTVTADLSDGSRRVHGDWEGGVVQWSGGGGEGDPMVSMMSREARSHADPCAPVCSPTGVTSPHLCPWAKGPRHPSSCISRCLLLVDMTGDRLPERRPSR